MAPRAARQSAAMAARTFRVEVISVGSGNPLDHVDGAQAVRWRCQERNEWLAVDVSVSVRIGTRQRDHHSV
jgi:hypothetical protein